jgi:CHAT domain-containing protein
MGRTYIDESIKLYQAVSNIDAYDLILKLKGAGSYFADMLDYERASLYLQRAKSLSQDDDENALLLFEILNRQLLLHAEFKQYGQADEVFTEIEKLKNKFGQDISPEEVAISYFNGAKIALETASYDLARKRVSAGLSYVNMRDYPMLVSNGIEINGLINKQLNKFKDASTDYFKVLAIREKLANTAYGKIGLAHIYENLSELFYASDNIDLSLQYLDKAERLLTISKNKNAEKEVFNAVTIYEMDLMRLLDIKSKIYNKIYSQNNDSLYIIKALSLYDQIDDLIDFQINRYQLDLSKLHIYELVVSYFENAISLCLDLYAITDDPSYVQKAYAFSAKTKAYLLHQQIQSKEGLLEEADQRSYNLNKKLLDHIYILKQALFEQRLDRDSLFEELTTAQLAYEDFKRETTVSSATHILNGEAISAHTIQQILSEDEVLVEFFMGSATLYTFWITSTGLHSYAVQRSKINSLTADLLEQFRNPLSTYDITKSANLCRMLLGPVLDAHPSGTLIIIPDGELHSLPFEALQMPNPLGGSTWLLNNYTIRYSYAGKFLRPIKKVKWEKFVGFGTNYSSDLVNDLREAYVLSDHQTLAQFDQTESELKDLSSTFRSFLYLNEEATLSAFKSSAPAADLLYLSLHGLVDIDNPTRSSLIFDNRTHPFVLYAPELSGEHIPASMAILSACHTADGKIYMGEGVLGISRAFMLASTSSIVSSLWEASSKTSHRVLKLFITMLSEGIDNDQALRQAKLRYLEEAIPSQQHPFYWANYILIGDQLQSNPPSFTSLYLCSIGLLLLLILAFYYYRTKKVNK